MWSRPPSRESGSIRSASATCRGTVSSTERSITVRERSTAGMPRNSESASRSSGSPMVPADSKRAMNAAPPGFPSSAARREVSSRRPRETRTRPSPAVTASATTGSYHGSGGEQVVLALAIAARRQIPADFLARPGCADRAHDDRLAGRTQGVGRLDREAPGDAFSGSYVDEAPRPQTPGLERAGEPFPRRPRSPQIEKPSAQGTAGEVVGAQLDHPVQGVRRACAGEAGGGAPPVEQHPRDLAELESRLEQAKLEVPVLGPARFAKAPHGFDGRAAEGHARVDERRFDEAGATAFVLRDHAVEPGLEAREPGRERPREASHEGAHRAEGRVALERVGLQAEAVGLDEVVGVHPGDQIAAAMTEADLESGDKATSFARDDPYPRVSRPRLRESARRRVRRGIVDADDLELRSVALGEQSLQRRCKRRRRVPGREEHTQHGPQDTRRCSGASLGWAAWRLLCMRSILPTTARSASSSRSPRADG